MAKSPEWKEFEKLVARIERAAAPRGAVVKSPDRIRDLITGQYREVDASIRTKTEKGDILVTVECRRRSRKADDAWIEQLISKREKIGATRTIAVSSTPFTAPAIKSAKHFGIELRVLSEVSSSDVESWFLPGGAVHLFRLIENIRCDVVLYDDSGAPSKHGFHWPHTDALAFYNVEHKSPFPIRDYMPIIEATHPELFLKVPLDGTKVELEFPIEWRPGELQFATNDGKNCVYLTKLVATISYQSAVCDLKSGVHHEYRTPNGSVLQRTVFNTKILGRPVTFEHQSDQGGAHKVACKFSLPTGNKI